MKANRKTMMAALVGYRAQRPVTTIVSGGAALARDTVRVRGAIESIDGSTSI